MLSTRQCSKMLCEIISPFVQQMAWSSDVDFMVSANQMFKRGAELEKCWKSYVLIFTRSLWGTISMRPACSSSVHDMLLQREVILAHN